MEINFTKYQGAGNDFILLDNRSGKFKNLRQKAISRLCNRRFGIGADGMMLLQNQEGYDFEMIYFNADGLPGSMCGNGGRCIVAFARHLGIIKQETNFLAVDGPHYAKISASGDTIELKMTDVNAIYPDATAFVLNTGSPHYVQEVTGLSQLDVLNMGKAIRNHPTYQAEGINVNFVEIHGNDLHVRTYERGVEDETFACGTGVTAAAMVMAAKNKEEGHIKKNIQVLGGTLQVSFDYQKGQFSNVFLTGAAELVFEGAIRLAKDELPTQS